MNMNLKFSTWVEMGAIRLRFGYSRWSQSVIRAWRVSEKARVKAAVLFTLYNKSISLISVWFIIIYLFVSVFLLLSTFRCAANECPDYKYVPLPSHSKATKSYILMRFWVKERGYPSNQPSSLLVPSGWLLFDCLLWTTRNSKIQP